ncbi:MAG: YfhO family protein [Blastocatellales bacterium]
MKALEKLLSSNDNARTDRTVLIALALLPFAFFWRETLGLTTLGDKDAVFWFFPAYRFVADQISSGAFPFWTPYLYSGSPLFAQWQAGVLDPLNLVYLLGVTSRTLTLSLQLSFSLSLVSTFLYGRQMGYRRRAAIVSAIIYSLSGFAVGRTLYPGFLHIVALVPLLLFFVERLYRSGRWRDALAGGLVVCWQLLAAHPQPVIYSSLLACGYAVFCAFFRADEKPARFWKRAQPATEFLVKFSTIFLAGAGLAAIQLLPAAETALRSVRQDWPYELFTLQSLHPVTLLGTLFPFLHGDGQGIYRMPFWGTYWSHNEGQIYLGLLALTLAVGAAVYAFRKRSGIGRFWAIVALIGVILALGKYSGPVAWALYYVPLLSHFRSPNRHWMEVALAVSMLAGMAVDMLIRGEARELPLRNIAIVLAAITVVAGGAVLIDSELVEGLFLALGAVNSGKGGFLQAAGAEFYLPVIVSVIATLLILFAARFGAAISTVLILFLLVDYALYARFAPIDNPDKLETLVGTAMPRSLADRQSERDPIRYHVLLQPSTGEFSPFWFYGHEMVTGYDPVLNTRYKTFSGIDEAGRTFIPTIVDKQDRTLDLLNVRYLLAPPGYFLLHDRSAEIASLDLLAGKDAWCVLDEGPVDSLRLLTALANSAGMETGQEVARIEARCGDGPRWTAQVRAGIETSEWAWDRQDVKSVIRHARAPIAESSPADGFSAHTYIATFDLPESIAACKGERRVNLISSAPDNVTLGIKRIEFTDSKSGRTRPLFRAPSSALTESDRWKELRDRSSARPYTDFRIFENTSTLPRTWLVGAVAEAFEGDQLKQIRGELKAADGRDFDPRKIALVEPVQDGSKPWYADLKVSPEGFSGEAKIVERNPNAMRVETQSNRPSLLVAGETTMPGWQALVDGREADIRQVDYMLRAVPLPEGKHTVEFFYRPSSVIWGAAISLLTALLLSGLFLFNRRRVQESARRI